jgi:ribosome-binding protein aMBF1 (putative translation factor)
MPKDALDEMISARTKKNPAFPKLLAAAEQRRRFAHVLQKAREKKGFTQTVVAAKMGTSAAVVSRLETGGDFQVSTLERYAAAVGITVTWKVG